MKRKFVGQVLTSAPWEPLAVIPADVHAIKALLVGKATEAEQLRVVEWIKNATGVTELEFRPDGERASVFAAGKRFIGLQFFTLSKAVFESPQSRS